MARVLIADVEALARDSYRQSAQFYKRAPTAWRAPWPPRPEPMLRKALEIKGSNVEGVEADDLLLRAAQAAIRRGDVR